MKAFKFSLQALQTLRQRQEQVALEQYARAVTSLESARTALTLVEEQCEKAWDALRNQLKEKATSEQIAQLNSYGLLLEEYRMHRAAAVERAQAVVAQRWSALIAARQAREAVEKYHERQRERYDRELMRDEQKMLDDLAGRRQTGATTWKPSLELSRN